MGNKGSKSGPLPELREKYAALYHKASPGTVERSAYYQLYLIMLNNVSSRTAATKIRALCEAVPEEFQHLCTSALEELTARTELTHEDRQPSNV